MKWFWRKEKAKPLTPEEVRTLALQQLRALEERQVEARRVELRRVCQQVVDAIVAGRVWLHWDGSMGCKVDFPRISDFKAEGLGDLLKVYGFTLIKAEDTYGERGERLSVYVKIDDGEVGQP